LKLNGFRTCPSPSGEVIFENCIEIWVFKLLAPKV
jgi:hypothetical protein